MSLYNIEQFLTHCHGSWNIVHLHGEWRRWKDNRHRDATRLVYRNFTVFDPNGWKNVSFNVCPITWWNFPAFGEFLIKSPKINTMCHRRQLIRCRHLFVHFLLISIYNVEISVFRGDFKANKTLEQFHSKFSIERFRKHKPGNKFTRRMLALYLRVEKVLYVVIAVIGVPGKTVTIKCMSLCVWS